MITGYGPAVVARQVLGVGPFPLIPPAWSSAARAVRSGLRSRARAMQAVGRAAVGQRIGPSCFAPRRQGRKTARAALEVATARGLPQPERKQRTLKWTPNC